MKKPVVELVWADAASIDEWFDLGKEDKTLPNCYSYGLLDSEPGAPIVVVCGTFSSDRQGCCAIKVEREWIKSCKHIKSGRDVKY